MDALRIVKAAVNGFIGVEQIGLATLKRSIDVIYEVVLDVLTIAVKHIQDSNA